MEQSAPLAGFFLLTMSSLCKQSQAGLKATRVSAFRDNAMSMHKVSAYSDLALWLALVQDSFPQPAWEA